MSEIDIYLKINNLSRELEIYVRLGDYKKDHAKKADEIFSKLVIEFDKFIEQRDTYFQYIEEISNQLKKGSSTKNFLAYFDMREFITNEEKLISELKINFCNRTFTSSLPTNLILNQIKESDNRITKIKPDYGEIVSGFVNSAENQIQKTKRDAIDRYSEEARKSDGYTNSFIENYRIYLNHYLIRDFNKIAESAGLQTLQYPRVITALKLDCTEKEYVSEIVKYEAREIPKLAITKQSNKISKETTDALNNYIEFINTELHYNYDFSSKLFYLNKTARSNFKPEASNRIIIATDDAFSIEDKLYKLSENEVDKRMFLSVFSFGNKDNEVKSLSKLAGNGKDNYEYIEVSNATKKLLQELQALKIK